jgi:gluconolactonase
MISFSCQAVLVAAGLVVGAVAVPEDNPIFPPDATLERLFDRTVSAEGGLTEGPAAAPDGSIYFTDILFGPDTQTMIQRFDPRTGKTTLATAKGSKANGMVFDRQGGLVVCDGADGGGRSVARWNLETGERTILADRFDGKRFNSPNDLCIDVHGRIYFTDPRYVGDEPRGLATRSVYLIEPDGKVVQFADDVEMPNGIVLSPDEKTLYVGDHNSGDPKATPDSPASKRGAMRVYAYPLSDQGLASGPRRTLIDFGKDVGCDGITVDAVGNIYLTCRSGAGPGVRVVDPRGKELAFFPTGPANQTGVAEPQGLPSNVEFGVGDDSHTLYVTIDTGFYRIHTKATGAPRAWAAGKP